MQIDKYESGTIRIPSRRLEDLASVLSVPVTFFFEDIPLGDYSDKQKAESLGPYFSPYQDYFHPKASASSGEELSSEIGCKTGFCPSESGVCEAPVPYKGQFDGIPLMESKSLASGEDSLSSTEGLLLNRSFFQIQSICVRQLLLNLVVTFSNSAEELLFKNELTTPEKSSIFHFPKGKSPNETEQS